MRVECIDCDFHKFLGYTDLTAYIGGWLQANNVPNADAASGYSGYNTSVRGPLGGTPPGLCRLASVALRGECAELWLIAATMSWGTLHPVSGSTGVVTAIIQVLIDPASGCS